MQVKAVYSLDKFCVEQRRGAAPALQSELGRIAVEVVYVSIILSCNRVMWHSPALGKQCVCHGFCLGASKWQPQRPV